MGCMDAMHNDIARVARWGRLLLLMEMCLEESLMLCYYCVIINATATITVNCSITCVALLFLLPSLCLLFK